MKFTEKEKTSEPGDQTKSDVQKKIFKHLTLLELYIKKFKNSRRKLCLYYKRKKKKYMKEIQKS